MEQFLMGYIYIAICDCDGNDDDDDDINFIVPVEKLVLFMLLSIRV